MKKKLSATTQTLVGIVTPYAWDESDQVCEVSLSATDDEEYIIENSQGFWIWCKNPSGPWDWSKSAKKFTGRST